MAELDWEATGDRIDALIAASASAGVIARERTEEVARLVADLYGAGLERLLGLLHDRGALTDEVAAALAGDELVAGLLLVHGLHPYPVETRLGMALDGLGVTVLEVTKEGVARLRLPPADGCGSAGFRATVQEAVEAVAPDVTGVELEETPTPTVIPVSSLFTRVGGTAAR